MTQNVDGSNLDSPKKTAPVLNVQAKFFRSENGFALSITVLFAALESLLLSRHEMWADEMQAWNIAGFSGSFVELLRNSGYEGHPALWYICLYVLHGFTRNPAAMQCLNLVVSSAAAFIFARFAPFTRLTRALFVFSYFSFFEYGTISRAYALGNLMLFSFCGLFPTGSHMILAATALGLLANTSVYGLIISVIFAILMMMSIVLRKSKRDEISYASLWVKMAPALSIFGILAAGAAYQIIAGRHAAHAHIESPGMVAPAYLAYHRTVGYFLNRFAVSSLPALYAMFPVPNPKKYFWNSNIFIGSFPQLLPVWSGCALLIIGTFVAALRRTPSILICFLLGTTALLAFGFAGARHYGLLFEFMMACLWLSRSFGKLVSRDIDGGAELAENRTNHKDRAVRIADGLITFALSVQVGVAVVFAAVDFAVPFSTCKLAAAFIKEHCDPDLPVMGTPDWVVSPISGWLDRKVWLCERLEYNGFVSWDGRTNYPRSDEELYERVKSLMQQNSISGCLFVKRPDKPFQNANFEATQLAVFPTAMVEDERYAVYLIKLKNATGSEPKVE